MSLELLKNAGANEMTETEFKNAAWYYPQPKDKAKNIKDHVAFCRYFRCLYAARPPQTGIRRTSQEAWRPQNEMDKSSWVISIQRYLARLTFGGGLDKNIVTVTTE